MTNDINLPNKELYVDQEQVWFIDLKEFGEDPRPLVDFNN